MFDIHSLLIVSVVFPMIMGGAIYFLDFQKKAREIFTMAVVLITTAIVISLVVISPSLTITLVKLTPKISIAFKLDGISKIFALLVSGLWPIATLYAFEYMYHEDRENTFFAFYTMTFGITLGIAFAENLITMYLFYECLTLVTIPLIMHSRNKCSKPAGIKYIVYSIAGATAAFAGIMMVYQYSKTFSFSEGGMTGLTIAGTPVMIAFLLMFLGFGVKAAVFPVYEWLPSVGVAPTPVTALLHAVAVVKSGCFAIIRITYYVFGAELLYGRWVQLVALALTAFTIAFGSVQAYRETHFKRRLAMSTVANLSYILFGAMLLTPFGLMAGLMHMLFHGVMKICLFFVAGATHVQAEADYVQDLKGFAKKMPITFAAFTIASLALIGVPPFCGFYSKFFLGFSAVQFGGAIGYIGIAALLISAFFTAAYLLSIVVKAYFPGKDFDYELIKTVKDPSLKMRIPFIVLSILCIAMGVFQKEIMGFVLDNIGGLF